MITLAALASMVHAKVTPLTTDLFDQMVVDNSTMAMRTEKPWFIKFYAPWCPHCQRMAPIWEQMSDLMDDNLNVAEVDCTAEESEILCQQFALQGYPTVMMLKDGFYYELEKGPVLENLLEFTDTYHMSSEVGVIPTRVRGFANVWKQIHARVTKMTEFYWKQFEKILERFYAITSA